MHIRFFFFSTLLPSPSSQTPGGSSKRGISFRIKNREQREETTREIYNKKMLAMSRERRWTTEEHGGSPARILPDLACECSSRGTRGMERDEGKRRVRGREENGGLGEEGEEENRVGGSIGAVFKRAHASRGTNGRARVASTSLAALGRNEDGGMEVAVACATPRAGFQRTLNFLPCPVFFSFFFFCLFSIFFSPSPVFLFKIFVDRLSLSLFFSVSLIRGISFSTISNNSVDYR